MKVYVDNEDKDFLDACLSECKVYEYVADELQYSDRLKLVSLSDYTKQVRKEVCEEIRDLAGNYFELPICHNCGELSNDDVVLTGNDLTEILDQIQGETNG